MSTANAAAAALNTSDLASVIEQPVVTPVWAKYPHVRRWLLNGYDIAGRIDGVAVTISTVTRGVSVRTNGTWTHAQFGHHACTRLTEFARTIKDATLDESADKAADLLATGDLSVLLAGARVQGCLLDTAENGERVIKQCHIVTGIILDGFEATIDTAHGHLTLHGTTAPDARVHLDVATRERIDAHFEQERP